MIRSLWATASLAPTVNLIEIPTGTATVIVAVITLSQGIVLALVGVVTKRVGRMRRDTSAVRDQVVNHHVDENGEPILMRDENDTRHAETAGWFKELRRDVGGLCEDVRGLRTDIRHERDRIDELEDTLTKKEGTS